MSSRQGVRSEKNSGGERDNNRGERYGSGRDQRRDGTRRRDENEIRGSDRKDRYTIFRVC